MRNGRKERLPVLPLLAGCLLFYAVPFVLVIQYSFVQGSGRNRSFVSLR